MSTCQCLFHAFRLGNHVHCMFISTFLVLFFLKSFIFCTWLVSCLGFMAYQPYFEHSPMEYEWFLDRSIWPIDGTLTSTTTLGQREPESKSDEGVLHTFQNWGFTNKYSLKPSPECPFLWSGLSPLQEI